MEDVWKASKADLVQTINKKRVVSPPSSLPIVFLLVRAAIAGMLGHV